MTPTQSAVQLALFHLRDELGAAIEVLDSTAERATVRVGGSDDCLLTIQAPNPTRPSFVVTYPKLSVKRDGRSHIDIATSRDVLLAGIRWIARQLVSHGVVRPEFVDALPPRRRK